METYLDNSATTPVCPEAVEAMMNAVTKTWGNPSSIHKMGTEASRLLEKSRGYAADALSCSAEEIFFTGSGTLADNTAVFGAAMARGKMGNRIITTSIEHPGVNECMKRLSEQGFEIIRLKADIHGNFSMEELAAAANSRTILVSIMAVNNEIGTINPINSIKNTVRRSAPNALIHVDAVQAFGKIPLNPGKSGIDMLSVSGHKVHGPKGVGALYIRKGVQIPPYVLGGGQENRMHSGTEAMPAIAGFGAAIKALPSYKSELDKISALNKYFISNLSSVGGVHINSPENALPYIINLSFPGVPSQPMVNSLSGYGVYVSSGSACKKGHRSEVLTSIGLDPIFADSAIRISLSRFTTKQDMDNALEAINKTVKRIRR